MSLHTPISTALLSYGMSGKVFHAPLLEAHPGFRITKVLERSRQYVRERYPHVESVSTLHDILDDQTIELVVVNTPHDTHADLARQALERGKHIVVEKPFTLTTREAQELIDLAERQSLVLSVFQNRRWDGDFLTLQQVVASNMVGRIVAFEAHYDRYRPVVDKASWKESAASGSGILYNLGAHLIDQAIVLFGMPQWIDAQVGVQRTGGTADDFYDIRMGYNGLNVTLKSSYLVREHGPRYALYGEAGSFIKYGLDTQEQALKDGISPGLPGWGQEPASAWGKLQTTWQSLNMHATVETIPGNYLTYYDTLFEAIRDGKDPGVTAEQALQVIQLIEATMQSNREQRAILCR